MSSIKSTLFVLLPIAFCSSMSRATEFSSPMKNCLLKRISNSSPETKIKDLISECDLHLARKKAEQTELSNIEKRIANEISTNDNPNIITSHKRNYMLPLTYVKTPNVAPFRDVLLGDPLDNLEAKFQISFKAPVFEDIFSDKDVLHFGFTIQSYWQMYNTDLSSPFRETNYQPELIYSLRNNWEIGGWKNQIVSLGFEHQSNGKTQSFSRSWNRFYANFLFEKENWAISFKPWYRIPESQKESPDDPSGDDNPDIEKFMGHFELTTVYHWDDQNISLMLRNSLRSNNKGAVQLDWSFPMGKRFKGYVQYFSGYGESLIDYNHNIQRLGVGVLLTDFF